MKDLTLNYYDSHPRCAACLYITKRFFEINCIWIAYAVFLIIVMVDHKSMAELVYLLIVVTLILVQVGGHFKTPYENELRLRKWWWLLVVYSCFYLFLLSCFQLVYSDDIDFVNLFSSFYDGIPLSLKSVAPIIGFY